jgi:RimJ/RimL family protein N-acetyltransferase
MASSDHNTASSTLVVPPSASAPGLLLRPWTERDIPAMLDAHRDPAVQRWLRRPVATADEARLILRARELGGLASERFSFAILTAGSGDAAGELAGGVSIRWRDVATQSAEVGYWVAAPWRGRGIAARAVNAVCEWALDLSRSQPLHRLELIHAAGNHASCRVAAKAGFALSALLPPSLPDFPDEGHLHVRLVGEQPQ